MNVLVTGASGLIGNALVPALGDTGARVTTTARHPSPRPGHIVCDLAAGDVPGLLAAAKPDAVVHLAGGAAGGDPAALYVGNVLTTVRLLDAMGGLATPPRLVVVGSSAEYGEAGGDLVGEDHPTRPVTDYGRAKLAQTWLARHLAARYRVPLLVARPFQVVGATLPPSSALGNIRRQLLEQDGDLRSITCGRLDIVRDFVPVAFVAAALAAATTRSVPGEVVNVCSGVGIELADVVAALGDRLGVAVRVDHDDALMGIPAAPRLVGDPSRLHTHLGLSLQPTADDIAAALLGD